MSATPIRHETRQIERRIPVYLKTCPACAVEFEAPAQRVYCSRACRMRHQSRTWIAAQKEKAAAATTD